MNNLINSIKNEIILIIKKLPNKIKNIVDLFLITETPLHAANASFFLIITGIPISMILFSLISLIPNVKIDDLIVHANNLFPNLSYIDRIVKYILAIARSLSSKSILSTNILVAAFAGSTTFYGFIIGIRKIHNVKFRSNYITLRLLALLSLVLFFVTIYVIITLFLLGTAIIEITDMYLPFLNPLINSIFNFKYIVTVNLLLVVLLLIYTTSTNYERKIRHNIIGAALATILWLIVSNLFSFYFSRFSLNVSVYGSISSLVVFLLWLYVCMNILFIGAIINEVLIPEEKIIRDRNLKIAKAFLEGDDATTDKAINDLHKLKKIKIPKRPKIDYN